MVNYLRVLLRVGIVGVAGLMLSGCLLQVLTGRIIIVESPKEHLFTVLALVGGNSSATICSYTDAQYVCDYVIAGRLVQSGVYLLSKDSPLLALIDPVVIQVPVDVLTVTATYAGEAGQQPLVVSRTGQFQATPDITITAEAGQTFLILDLPPAVAAEIPPGDPEDGLPLTYTLSYERVQPISQINEPQTLKLMLTGKVVVNEHTYYVPLLPCVTDFASLPALELPQSDTPQDLQPAIGDWLDANPAAPCDHEVYNFNNVPPPPLKVFLPALLR
jgi:hypothetical protein